MTPLALRTSDLLPRVEAVHEAALLGAAVAQDGARGVPRRGVPEQLGDDDHEEQELDEVQGESGGGDDVVEVTLV